MKLFSLVTTFGWLLCNPAHALLISADRLPGKLEEGKLKARINVEQVQSIPDSNFFARYRAQAKIEHILDSTGNQGAAREGETIQITGCGGEINGTGVLYAGDARPRRGQRYDANLAWAGDAYRVAGFEAGLKPLRHTYSFSRNRTDGSNGDGEGPYLYWDTSFMPLPYYLSGATFAGFPQFVEAIDAAFQTWRDVPDANI